VVARETMNQMQITLSPDPAAETYRKSGVWGRATLDALFRRNIRREPDRVILADPPDRESFTGQAAKRLKGQDCDRIVGALAQRFQELGLKPGSVIAIQAPNIVELPLLILACLRAGLLPAVIPPLWRERDMVRALEALAPKALFGPTQVDDDQPADRLRYVAAALFSVRFVLSVGPQTPDGVVALDDCFERPNGREPRALTSTTEPADNAAIVTFRTTAQGHAPVLRSHNHWISAGLAPLLETGMEPGETIATCMMQSSFAGLSTGFMPWLLAGGALHLHQPIALDVLGRTLVEDNVNRLVVPGSFSGELAAKLPLAETQSLRSIIGVFSDPRRVADARPIHGGIETVDVVAFDEWGLVARRRRGGRTSPCPLGQVRHPENGANGPLLLETKLTTSGRLELRGPMTPTDVAAADGYQSTGFAGRPAEEGFFVVGRNDQVACVGGLAVGLDDVSEVLREIAPVKAVRACAVVDPLFGERIEVRYAPSDLATISSEGIETQFRDAFDHLQIAPHKVPSRIVADPTITASGRRP
jgi:non-ribosomal peptide synthetase component E (peptide arylation enzyme)